MEDRSVLSPNKPQGPNFPRQESICNLSFPDFQTQIGNISKTVMTNMNFNELANANSIEEDQQVQNPSPPGPFFLENFTNNEVNLSKKMANDVWKEFVNQERASPTNSESFHQQMAVGDSTLEQFLVHAGFMNSSVQNNPISSQQSMTLDPGINVPRQREWMQLQMGSVPQQHQLAIMSSNFSVLKPGYNNQGVEGSYTNQQLTLPPISVPAMPVTSLDSTENVENKQGRSDEITDKTIERRQKRMIKNRESAARSRARKQAYTNQLENEVIRLRKINNSLKKQKEMELLLSSNKSSMPKPKYQLRRTSSATF